MPGLINKENRSALPLSVSDITSCVRGYTLAMTASMTYENIEDHAIEGIFIYPLEENSIVVGFESMISSQIITLQIKDKAKIDDCYLDCCNTSNGALQSGSGHIVIDEDLGRTVLVVNLGVIPPMETVHILVSTSSELSTLPNGGISVSSPPACTPRVQRTINEEQGLSPNFSRTRDKHSCASSPHDQTPNSPQLWLASLLEEEAINSMDYEFNFQLEIRAPYLLAGVESPSHAIRADADPLARSATSVVITLADKYTYDCPVKILIYPSEPHLPHVLIENGDMTQEEYDEYLHGRSDFIKATKKDSSNERKVDIIHRRLHKDILHNPVVMLNFCPDLKSISSDLRKVHGEFIFLIDRSGSMSGVNINRVKDAMVVILKSLVPGCLFNIISFGSTFKSLFTTSQNYEEEALALACEYVRKIRADMGGTNILAPLNWILRQPMFSGHPRLLFLLTDGAVSNTGKVIELVRSHARYIRCFTFGIGQNACRRLVQGLATVSKGTAEFLADGERLQPKMIKSLKKTLSPVLSDISIEWLFPETKEVLLSPVGNTFLFPGDSLIGYSVVCDTTRYHANPKSDKRRRYSMMRSIESASSVFYHSQEEDVLRTGSDSQGSYKESPLYDPYQDSMTDSPAATEQDTAGLDCKTSPRRRAYSTNQIADYNPAKKVYTPSDPSSVVAKNPLRRAKVQELIGQMSPEHEAQWRSDYQPQLASLCATSSRGRPASCHRPLPQQEPPLPQEADSEPHFHTQPQDNPQPSGIGMPPAARNSAGEDGSRSSTDSPSVGSIGDTDGYGHQLCQAETPQETQTSDLGAANQLKGDCKAVVSGLLCGKLVKWEVVFDIEPFLNGREREEKVHEELWNETFHHMAGRSIICDFEHMADKECEIEHGSGRKYQLYAIHTSKACNILSKYTAFVPIDLDTNEYLPTCIEYIQPAEGVKKGSHSRSRSGSRKNRGYSIGLGRSQSGGMSEEAAEDALLPNNGEDSVSPCSTPSSSGWERCSFTEVSQRSPSVTSDQSQKSVESLFSARLALSRTRLLTRAAKGFMCRSHSKSGDSSGESDNENKDYIPLVLLQLASGAFPLDTALCDAISVPMDKLKWTSPFTSHRTSLGHLSHSSSRRAESADGERRSLCEPETYQQPAEYTVGIHSPSHLTKSSWTDAGPSSLGSPSSAAAEPPLSPHSQGDSGRGSGSGALETASPSSMLKRMLDPESMVWATAVALAWLEHSSASHFIEWELVAAKASMWLSAQEIPEGRDLASVKAAANQLFIILRHWDENLQLNMLCYNPNSV
ncbi:von Willebrand factor A domain-containing protein 5B1 isoform X2 [Epinephelus fuscoguttatus]|uniref:von Willebrand factor A domain-containing protein 5B1 isoform X2 n=1 Tax=Epinephelus fuscoguttatus TaxID=293821 RepID=UPI0020D0214A|nr:von Willebrand factor A domain-containing protein 5B1 isoform X2 [Epinephelus fuscoguttatus]